MSRGFGSLDAPSASVGLESFSDLSVGGDKQVVFAKKKYGTMGRPCELFVNFFKIQLNKSTPNYFHYNIEILKEEEAKAGGGGGGRKAANQPKKDSTPKSKKSPKRLNDDIFREVFRKFPQVFQINKVLPVFDGEKNFYSVARFNLQNSQWSGVVSVKDKEKIENFRVNITTPEFSHDQNLASLYSRDQIMPVELQALDIILRNG